MYMTSVCEFTSGLRNNRLIFVCQWLVWRYIGDQIRTFSALEIGKNRRRLDLESTVGVARRLHNCFTISDVLFCMRAYGSTANLLHEHIELPTKNP